MYFEQLQRAANNFSLTVRYGARFLGYEGQDFSRLPTQEQASENTQTAPELATEMPGLSSSNSALEDQQLNRAAEPLQVGSAANARNVRVAAAGSTAGSAAEDEDAARLRAEQEQMRLRAEQAQTRLRAEQEQMQALREAPVMFGQLLNPPRCVCFGAQFPFTSLGDSVSILGGCGCGAICMLLLLFLVLEEGVISTGVALGAVLSSLVLAYALIRICRCCAPVPDPAQLARYQELYVLPLGPVSEANPLVFFDIEISDQDYFGRIEMELKADIAPRTAENFLRLCTGEHGFGYRDTIFHRVIKGWVCYGGDTDNKFGGGGQSIYGGAFEDENFILKHTGPGILSMASMGCNNNKSKFCLALKAMPRLDGERVVFGQVVTGFDTIKAIGRVGSSSCNPCGCTYHEVKIVDCGVVEREQREPLTRTESAAAPQPEGNAEHTDIEVQEDDEELLFTRVSVQP